MGSGLGAGSKKRWSPVLGGLFIFATMASSSLEGADESEELSESAILFAVSRFTLVGRKHRKVECHRSSIELEECV